MQQKKEFITAIKENEGILFRVTSIYGKNKEDQKDLYQEIVYQLWKSFPSFRNDSKISTWMYRIGLNTAITLYRKSKRSIVTQDFDSVLHRIKSTYYDNTEEEQLKLMYKAIHTLSDIDKALIFLYLEEKNYKEISETIGISEVNARVKMNRIKTRLRTILNP